MTKVLWKNPGDTQIMQKKYYFSKTVYKRNIIDKIDYKTKFELRGQVIVLM